MMSRNKNNDSFITEEITNKQIYDEVVGLRKEVRNQKKLATWAISIAGASLSFGVFILTLLFSHINK